MLERLLLTAFLALIGAALFVALRYRHMRRLKIGLVDNRPTLLYFRSDNCGPCITQAHYLEILAEKFQDRFALQKVDTELEPEKAATYGVFTLPTTLVIDQQGDVKFINYGLTNSFRLAQQLESVV
jgi:thiol-disulfide isomerase/thioredoxin